MSPINALRARAMRRLAGDETPEDWNQQAMTEGIEPLWMVVPPEGDDVRRRGPISIVEPVAPPAEDREALLMAVRRDQQNELMRGIEGVGSALRSGITLTPQSRPTIEATDYEGAERSRAAALRAEGLRRLAGEADMAKATTNERELERRIRADEAREGLGGQRFDESRRQFDLKLAQQREESKRKASAGAAAAARKAAKEEEKAGAKALEGMPAEWEGAETSSRAQREKFAGVVNADKKMRGMTQKMRALLKDAGAGRLLPGSNAAIKQLATQIQIEGKNIADLGALSGPDMAMMNAIAADPTKLTSLAKDTSALLDGLDSWGANSVSANAETIGARRRPKAGGGAQPAGAKPPRTLRLPSGEVVEVDE